MNFRNRTLWTGDNLDILRGLNSECVDLIYLDPPFNSNRDYSAPIGSEAAGAAFKDTWTLDDVDLAWHGEIAEKHPDLYSIIDAAGIAHGKGMKSYLIMMGIRLLEMRRVLKPTGSIYLHCDPTASHYLKMLMDVVFTLTQFRNEIVWHYANKLGTGGRVFDRQHDILLWYSGDGHTFNVEREPVKLAKPQPITQKVGGRRVWLRDEMGKRRYRVSKTKRVGDTWIIPIVNPMAKERIGYPTQKPLALLERIIKASSNEGDVVLDPFCGCATALVAADRLNRQWVGIDLSPMAATLVLRRLRADRGPLFDDVLHRMDIPQRTDLGDLPSYRSHKHVLYGKQEGICAGCQVLFAFRNFTIDHIIPRRRGGTDHLDNLQLLCGACNSMKGTDSQEAFIARLKREGIRT